MGELNWFIRCVVNQICAITHITTYYYTLGLCFGGNGLSRLSIPYFFHSKGDFSMMKCHIGQHFDCGFNGCTHMVHLMYGRLVIRNYTHNYILLHTWYVLWWQWLVNILQSLLLPLERGVEYHVMPHR